MEFYITIKITYTRIHNKDEQNLTSLSDIKKRFSAQNDHNNANLEPHMEGFLAQNVKLYIQPCFHVIESVGGL